MKSIRRGLAVAIGSLVIACGGSASTPPALQALTQPAPLGTKISNADIVKWRALFDAQPLIGGQAYPRSGKFIDSNTVIFAQFNHPSDQASELRYVGIQTKSVFCKETQSDPHGNPVSSFTHFHRYVGTTYGTSHGGPPGSEGYWGTWIAADDFTAPGSEPRPVKAGVDYAFSPTPPPSCGASIPVPAFTPAGAGRISKDGLAALVAFFSDTPFSGGQKAPLVAKWVTDQVFVFVMFDKSKAVDATAIMHYGIGKRGSFCASSWPTADFSTFHRWQATDWSAGALKGDNGYWMLVLDTTGPNFGVDHNFEVTVAPSC